MTDQMTVTRNADGSHSPAYDDAWPEATQLEWLAGCAALETGLHIEVKALDQGRSGLYTFLLKGPRRLIGNGNMTFQEACGYLDGVRAGVNASRP